MMRTKISKRQGRFSRKHKKWQLQEAKAKFSRVINEAVSDGYQTITKNGEPVAYVVSKKDFDLFLHPPKTLLQAFEDCPYPDIDLDIERSSSTVREVDL
ncbi:MAG TPA: type II toxin-antitoxin system Phd/YefM family antitoxin [Chlamydiales bacterium]|jgi:prevent-host-death family protein